MFNYKNIAYAKQAAFGTSLTVGSVYLPVKTFELNNDPTVEVVSQTTNTAKGMRRAINLKNDVKGNASFNVDFFNVGYWLGLGWGSSILGTALGASATEYTFLQNDNGIGRFGRFDKATNPVIEAWQDAFVSSFSLTAADGVVEGTVDITASQQFAGATFTPSVTESRVVSFANAQWFYGNAQTTAAAGATIEIPVTNWTLTYKSGFEGVHQSGSNNITRINTTFPSLELSMTRFFDGNSANLVMRDNVYTEDTERSMLLKLTSDSDDLIAGITQYSLKFPLPKVKLKISTRPYNAGEQTIEDITGEALYHDASGYMCEPILTTINGATF